jgi:hypothetical protein
MRIGRTCSTRRFSRLLEQFGPRVFQLFGADDQTATRGLWMRDWRKLREQIAYVLDYAEPEGTLFKRVRRIAVLAAKGPAGRRALFEVRCDRGTGRRRIPINLQTRESSVHGLQSHEEVLLMAERTA